MSVMAAEPADFGSSDQVQSNRGATATRGSVETGHALTNMVPFNIIHIRVNGAHSEPGRPDFVVETLCGIRVPEALCGDPSKATCLYCVAASGRATVRQGRKARNAQERQLISDRMKRYWASRRKHS